MKRSLLALLSTSLLLVACGNPTTPNVLPTGNPSVQPVDGLDITPRPKGIFTNAISKRVLALPASGNVGAGQNVNAPNAPTAAPSAAPMGMPAPMPVSEAAVGRGGSAPFAGDAGKMMMPCCYGEFNNYAIQYAEESTFAGATDATLLQAYNNTVKPLLAQWDAAARLVESRANFGNSDDGNVEYIYLPGEDANEPLKIRPDYFFRFASSPMKEILNVYVMKDRVLVHRMIWGEPNVDLSKVKLDSNEALTKARAALNNRSTDPGYPVYPGKEYQDPNLKVIYEVPSNATSQIYLNQNGEATRYFINFEFETEVPTWVYDTTSDQGGPKPVATPTEGATPSPTSSPAVAMMQPKQVTQKQMMFGSVEVDAVTGAIRQVNRPTYYFDPTPRPIQMPYPEAISARPMAAPGAAM